MSGSESNSPVLRTLSTSIIIVQKVNWKETEEDITLQYVQNYTWWMTVNITNDEINILKYEINSKILPIETTHLNYRGTQKLH